LQSFGLLMPSPSTSGTTYVGGRRADELFARDGLGEPIDCGGETDTGEADTIDILVDCEGAAVSSALSTPPPPVSWSSPSPPSSTLAASLPTTASCRALLRRP
jgi:hypothetical protein